MDLRADSRNLALMLACTGPPANSLDSHSLAGVSKASLPTNAGLSCAGAVCSVQGTGSGTHCVQDIMGRQPLGRSVDVLASIKGPPTSLAPLLLICQRAHDLPAKPGTRGSGGSHCEGHRGQKACAAQLLRKSTFVGTRMHRWGQEMGMRY